MRIAFISYEYPPDTAHGGIATYVEQAANILKQRGHDVEVFCGSAERNISEEIAGVWVHRCFSNDHLSFLDSSIGIFSERHQYKNFDIIESPEIHANAIRIKEKFPRIPMIVRLHMPLFVQMRLLNFYTSWFTKARFFVGSLRRGKIKKYGQYDYTKDIDYKITSMAQGISAPSDSMREIIINEWKLNPGLVKVIPNPFIPTSQLLNIPIENNIKDVITFIGKLNVHKGIVNLVKTIPLVVKKYPDVLFQLIGSDSYFAVAGMNMSDYVKKELKGFEKNYKILGTLEYKEVMKILESTTICIFPSIWECFGMVCLEAMSAGRAVIGSKEGGMKDILSNNAGELVDPLNVNDMANAVIKLLSNEKLRFEYGKIGRQKVLSDYNVEVMGKALELHYTEVLQKSNNNIN